VALQISGFDRDQEKTISRWCKEILRYLRCEDEELFVRPHVGNPRANDQGVELDERLFSGDIHPELGLRPPAWYIGFILYEEVAHSLLGRIGVPHGGIPAVFFQELYATWVQISGFKGRRTTLQAYPIRPGATGEELYYSVGKQLGAAIGGSTQNRAFLEEWIASPNADWKLVELVRLAEMELRPPLRREDVAYLYRSYTERSPNRRA
jgi:hypothetical protein